MADALRGVQGAQLRIVLLTREARDRKERLRQAELAVRRRLRGGGADPGIGCRYLVDAARRIAATAIGNLRARALW